MRKGRWEGRGRGEGGEGVPILLPLASFPFDVETTGAIESATASHFSRSYRLACSSSCWKSFIYTVENVVKSKTLVNNGVKLRVVLN